MGAFDLPDNPVIQNLMRTGTPDGRLEQATPHCPVCGAECEKLYKNRAGEYVGCDACVDVLDAWNEPGCFNREDD